MSVAGDGLRATASGAASQPAFCVCVVGLGKIGLALAAQYARRGLVVHGADIDPVVVETVNRGQAPSHSEDGLQERISEAAHQGLLSATLDTATAVRSSNVVVVIVPLLVDAHGQPDFRALDAATRAIAAGLRPGTLVIYETTVPLGSTRERFGPMLQASGLRVGEDFHLAFSPERVLVGRTFDDLQKYPKIVGGTTAEATQRAACFYAAALGATSIEMPNAESAEFVKLAETTYRDVNIGLANELARFAQARGIDAAEAFQAANTQPFSKLHTPGVGVGGHCIPVYPQFLLGQAKPDELAIVRRAREVNDSMAEYAVELLVDRLGDLRCKRILILGLAYRGGVKEASNSSALLLIEALHARGARALINDPLFSVDELHRTGAEPIELDDATDVDAIVLQTDHPEYLALEWTRFRAGGVLLDGRNVLDRRTVEHAGLDYLGVGRFSTIAK